jgi:hypothetical protein
MQTYVNVGMIYRLARRVTAVHTNVKSLRQELSFEYILDLSNKIKGICVFLGRHLPDRFHVSLWNNERMTVRNRKVIQKRKRQRRLG